MLKKGKNSFQSLDEIKVSSKIYKIFNLKKAEQNGLKTRSSNTEIAFRPARVLMQDYTGIPAVADLAAMRDAVKSKNKDPNKINPLSTVDLVIDHSVMVDAYATKDSFKNCLVNGT